MTTNGLVALVTAVALTTARFFDLATTLYFDPSLEHEGNPLVLFFGAGLPVLVASMVLIWVICLISVLAFWRGSTLKLGRPPINFRDFLRTWVRRVVKSRHRIADTLPGGERWNEGLQAIRLFGLGLSWAMIFGSGFAIHAWFATHDGSAASYQRMYSALRVGKLNFFTLLTTPLGFAVGSALFFLLEYRSAQSASSNARFRGMHHRHGHHRRR
jgi:hypothetical protein